MKNILDSTNFKYLTNFMDFVSERIDHIKSENTGYKHFSSFPMMILKAFPLWVLKTGDYISPQWLSCYQTSKTLCLIKIEFILLLSEFNRNEKNRNKQIPELRSNLVEPRRSLTDKISTKGDTQMFQQRKIRWQHAHGKIIVTLDYLILTQTIPGFYVSAVQVF